MGEAVDEESDGEASTNIARLAVTLPVSQSPTLMERGKNKKTDGGGVNGVNMS